LSGYLLDTHALIWWFADHPQLTQAAREVLLDETATAYVSAASAYEIANKHRIGKLPQVAELLDGYSDHLTGQGFAELPITAEHARIAGLLQIEHRDPFDRLLIAQARFEGLTLISNERLFDEFGVKRVW
jgi:PIN domain nuclease of toxin-antitoxin system